MAQYFNIIKALKPETAYVLIFGLCLLFGTGAAYSLYTAKTFDQRVFPFLVILVSMLSALYAIKLITMSRVQNSGDISSVVKLKTLPPANFNELVNNLVQNINTGQTEYKNKVFDSVMLEDLQEWSLLSDSWGKGEYRTQKDYNHILIKFYKDALSTVFATCLPEYVGVWKTEFGKQLLKSHNESTADITRIFIFERETDVKQSDLEVLVEHAKYEPKIKSFIYFDDEDDNFSFPPMLSKDFTLIDDGEALGITVSFGVGNMEAQWRFKGPDGNKWIPLIIKCKEQLLSVSKPLNAWLREKDHN